MSTYDFFPLPFEKSFRLGDHKNELPILFSAKMTSYDKIYLCATSVNSLISNTLDLDSKVDISKVDIGKYFKDLIDTTTKEFQSLAKKQCIGLMHALSENQDTMISRLTNALFISNLVIDRFPTEATTMRFVFPIHTGLYANGFIATTPESILIHGVIIDDSENFLAGSAAYDIENKPGKIRRTFESSVFYRIIIAPDLSDPNARGIVPLVVTTSNGYNHQYNGGLNSLDKIICATLRTKLSPELGIFHNSGIDKANKCYFAEMAMRELQKNLFDSTEFDYERSYAKDIAEVIRKAKNDAATKERKDERDLKRKAERDLVSAAKQELVSAAAYSAYLVVKAAEKKAEKMIADAPTGTKGETKKKAAKEVTEAKAKGRELVRAAKEKNKRPKKNKKADEDLSDDYEDDIISSD